MDGNCCDRCKKIVYALEYVGAGNYVLLFPDNKDTSMRSHLASSKIISPLGVGGRTYHRECFRCAGLSTGKDCDAVLAMNNYFVAADGKHRCKKCHIAFERARF